MFAGRNLILIQVESLQGFVIGRTINGRPITPNLDRLVQKSLYFFNVQPQTGRGGTADAEFLSQLSLFPLKDEVSYWQLKDNHFSGLPAVLRSRGYETVAMHGYAGTFYNRRAIYRRFGFSRTLFDLDFHLDDRLGWGLSDKSFLRQALGVLDQTPQPFYAFLITLTSHHPFDAHYPVQLPLQLGPLEGTLIGRYLQAIHYTDEALGEFLEGLRARGLLQNTIVALYGDHSAIPVQNREELGQFLNVSLDPVTWTRLQAVPLIVRLPSEEHRLVTRAGGQIDIAPTLANLLGTGAAIYPGLGHDLLGDGSQPVIFLDGSWLDERFLFLSPAANHGETGNYDIRSGRPLSPALLAHRTAGAREWLAFSDVINRHDLVYQLRRDANLPL